MAFQLSGWARASVSANEPVQSLSLLDSVTNVVIAVNSYTGCFREYNYYSAVVTVAADVGTISGDTLAAISTAGYFNPVFYDLQIGDIINTYSAYDGSSARFVVTNVGTFAAPSVILLALSSGNIVSGSVLSPNLTAAQICAMYAAPVAIPGLAAPGAGYAYLITSFSVNMTFGTAALTNGGVVALQYGNAVHGAGPLATGTIAAAVFTAAQNSYGYAAGAVSLATSANAINTAIFISNQTAAFTQNASTDTFQYQIGYRVIPMV